MPRACEAPAPGRRGSHRRRGTGTREERVGGWGPVMVGPRRAAEVRDVRSRGETRRAEGQRQLGSRRLLLRESEARLDRRLERPHERSARFRRDGAEPVRAVAPRATGRAVVARTVRGACLVVNVRGRDRLHRLRREVRDTRKLHAKHERERPEQGKEVGGRAHHAFSGLPQRVLLGSARHSVPALHLSSATKWPPEHLTMLLASSLHAKLPSLRASHASPSAHAPK